MFLVCGDWLWDRYWEDQERAVQSPGEKKGSHTSYVQLLGGPETLHYTFCSIWMDSGRLPSPPRRMSVHRCLDRCLFLQVLCLQEVSQAPHHFRSAQTSHPYSETDGDWDNAGAEIKVHVAEKSNINIFFPFVTNVGQSIDFHASPAARNVAFSGYSCFSITLCVVSGESDFFACVYVDLTRTGRSHGFDRLLAYSCHCGHCVLLGFGRLWRNVAKSETWRLVTAVFL